MGTNDAEMDRNFADTKESFTAGVGHPFTLDDGIFTHCEVLARAWVSTEQGHGPHNVHAHVGNPASPLVARTFQDERGTHHQIYQPDLIQPETVEMNVNSIRRAMAIEAMQRGLATLPPALFPQGVPTEDPAYLVPLIAAHFLRIGRRGLGEQCEFGVQTSKGTAIVARLDWVADDGRAVLDVLRPDLISEDDIFRHVSLLIGFFPELAPPCPNCNPFHGRD